jgi:microfibrillar-associated protein 1
MSQCRKAKKSPHRNQKRRHPSHNSDQYSYQSAFINDAQLSYCNKLFRRGRVTVAEEAALAQDTEEALKKKAAEAEERRQQSHNMVAESIRRELAESRVALLCFAYTLKLTHDLFVEEKEAEVPDIDDTDGVDPQGEFEAWRLRELARIKRDKEDEVRRELEREEIERRRALPEEQRLKEDMEHAEKSRAEKPKGQQKFLQKYWHKGAFHQVSLFDIRCRYGISL